MLRRRKCAAISLGIEISATRPRAKHFYPREKKRHIRPQSDSISIEQSREQIRKAGMQEKKKAFAGKGAEIYAKT
jgi:hypothetical protein